MSRRAQAARRVLSWLRQGALLALWALVGWGTLLLLATAAGVVRDGPATALARLLPGPGAGPWGWLNGASAALAVAAWVILGALLVLGRIGRHASALPGERDRLPDEPS